MSKRTNFTAKNERRRKARGTNARERANYARARAARRAYGVGGAFGSWGRDHPIHELCATGRRSRLEDEP